jgi:hypothetical protein
MDIASDLLSLLIALVCFALVVALIEGLDRV